MLLWSVLALVAAARLWMVVERVRHGEWRLAQVAKAARTGGGGGGWVRVAGLLPPASRRPCSRPPTGWWCGASPGAVRRSDR